MDAHGVVTSGPIAHPIPPDGHLDLERPNAARMYDYYLGGSANVAVDREAANDMIRVAPDTVYSATANRSFVGRAVRYLCAQGIDQFLDLGSGIPTVGNVHEIAQHLAPGARVAYVDIEPVAVSYGRRLLTGRPLVTMTQADIRRPETVLSAPGVAGLLDFTRPVAVLAAAILHVIADSDRPAEVIAGYRAACVPGSYLAISHVSPLTFKPAQVRRSLEIYARTPTPVVYRDRREIGAFLAGYDLVEPGLVLLPHWRPDEPVSDTDAIRSNFFGAVGYLPE